jgi:hypothetical protein
MPEMVTGKKHEITHRPVRLRYIKDKRNKTVEICLDVEDQPEKWVEADRMKVDLNA